MNATTLPILDLARYADPAEKAAFLADLRHAARDIGFFYLINHASMRRCSRPCSSNPAPFCPARRSKAEGGNDSPPHFRGYNRAASELTQPAVSPTGASSSISAPSVRRCNFSERAPRWQRLQGPNLWPGGHRRSNPHYSPGNGK
jgi:isopenicillin N synthase-like dioxygenase